MADLQERSGPTGSPSVEEAIAWLTDAYLAVGAIGFSTDYIAPKEYLKNWKIVGRPNDEWPQEDPSSSIVLERFLNDAYNGETLAYKRAALVNADKELKKEVKREIRRRLIAAGKSEEDIEGKIGKSPTLVPMVEYLYEVENPKPEGIKTIRCRVSTGLPGTEKLVPVRLPMKASLRDIHDLLRQFVHTELLCTSTKGISDQELDNVLSAWRYRIVVEKRKGKCTIKDGSSVLLRDDSDYRDMVKKVPDLDSKNLTLLLTPVTPPTKPSMYVKPLTKINLDGVDTPNEASETDNSSPKTLGSPVSDTDRAWEEWLAAERFKPVNWSEVTKRIDEGEDISRSTSLENWET